MRGHSLGTAHAKRTWVPGFLLYVHVMRERMLSARGLRPPCGACAKEGTAARESTIAEFHLCQERPTSIGRRHTPKLEVVGSAMRWAQP